MRATSDSETLALLVVAYELGCANGGGDLGIGEAHGAIIRDYFFYLRRRTASKAVVRRLLIESMRFRLRSEWKLIRNERNVLQLVLASERHLGSLSDAIREEQMERPELTWGSPLDPATLSKLSTAIEFGFDASILIAKFRQKRLQTDGTGKVTAIAPWRLKVVGVGVPVVVFAWLLLLGWFAFAASPEMLAGWTMLSLALVVFVGRAIVRELSNDIAIAIALRSVRKLRGIETAR